MNNLSLYSEIEHLPMKAPFRISGYTFDEAAALVVTLRDGECVGRGEAEGVYYLGETPSTMAADVEQARSDIEGGVTRDALREIMPAGGARNAVDCALWQLEAQRQGKPVWELAGMAPPRPLLTTFTVGVDEPEAMAEAARAYAQARAIKIKLAGELDLDVERVRAVRAARPDIWIAVDANQGFDRASLERLVPTLDASKVSLIEQPLPRGQEEGLEGFSCGIPVAADESALTLADVQGLVGRFDIVNIKLDKCGGLTEGLLIAAEARRLGLQAMVGCMGGSSLGMAPAFILGQVCDIVDLDGPVFLKKDRDPGVVYEDGYITCPDNVWDFRKER